MAQKWQYMKDTHLSVFFNVRLSPSLWETKQANAMKSEYHAKWTCRAPFFLAKTLPCQQLTLWMRQAAISMSLTTLALLCFAHHFSHGFVFLSISVVFSERCLTNLRASEESHEFIRLSRVPEDSHSGAQDIRSCTKWEWRSNTAPWNRCFSCYDLRHIPRKTQSQFGNATIL